MKDKSHNLTHLYSNTVGDLYQMLYDQIVLDINNKILNKGKVNFALCGGRSVANLFKLFKESKNDIDWQKVNIFMVDERIVPISSEDSNFKLSCDQFINHLQKTGLISDSNLFPYIYDPDREDYGTDKYSELLSNNGGKFDLILLSSGEDGHIGALYPKHHSIKDDSEFFISMSDSPKLPKLRMSSSRRLLSKSDIAYLFVMGESKRDVLHTILNQKDIEDVTSCPARIIYKIPNSYLITDLKED